MASESDLGTIRRYFDDFEDPRIDRTRLHELLDIIAITICGVVCGADSWVEDFGRAKESWLKTFLRLLGYRRMTPLGGCFLCCPQRSSRSVS